MNTAITIDPQQRLRVLVSQHVVDQLVIDYRIDSIGRETNLGISNNIADSILSICVCRSNEQSRQCRKKNASKVCHF